MVDIFQGQLKRTPWNKGLKIGSPSTEHRLKISLAKKGKPGKSPSEETRKKMSEIAIRNGNKPPNLKGYKHTREHIESSKKWKGDKASQGGIHTWIKRHFEDPGKCEHCGKSEGRLEWSNLDHKYSRKLEDWQRVCPSCHFKYDNRVMWTHLRKKEKLKRKEMLVKMWNSFKYV